MSPEIVEAMRTVANYPDEWFLVAEYPARGTASGAANRMRQRDWESILNENHSKKSRYVWDIVSRSYAAPKKGAGVWARRRTGRTPARAGA